MKLFPFPTHLTILITLLAHATMAAEVAIPPANPADLSAAAPKVAISETDWCTVATPATAKHGTPIEIKVTLKAGVQPGKLSAHLYWLKTDGSFDERLSWAPARDAKGGESYTFTHHPKLTTET